MRLLAGLLCMLALAGCSPGTPRPNQPTASVSAPVTAPTESLIVMPDVVGLNAAVALDQLHRLGLKNVDLGAVDGHKFVLLPQNWTVRTQSAKPGDRIAPAAKVVLGCARNS